MRETQPAAHDQTVCRFSPTAGKRPRVPPAGTNNHSDKSFSKRGSCRILLRAARLVTLLRRNPRPRPSAAAPPARLGALTVEVFTADKLPAAAHPRPP